VKSIKGLLGTLRIQSEGFELEELPCPAFPLHAQPTKLSLSLYLLCSNLARNGVNTKATPGMPVHRGVSSAGTLTRNLPATI
jgi:hypothetical protein